MKNAIMAALAAALTGLGGALAQPADTTAATRTSPTDPLSALFAELEFSGNILVARHGDVLVRETVDTTTIARPQEMDAETRFPIASMTKSFTAALVLGLVDDGQLDLDRTLAELLPDFDVAYAHDVTLRHLLRNRSGIPHYTAIPGWFDNAVKAGFTEDSFMAALEALEPAFTPGSDYLYSNVNYYLLARIVDRYCGQPYEACLRSRVLDPLGLDDTGQIYREPGPLATDYLRNDEGLYTVVPVVNPALFRGTASLYSTIDDLQAWGQAVLDGEVYSPAAAEEAFNADTPMAWEIGQLPLGGETPAEALYYNGRLIGYLSLILLLPEQDGVIVVLNNNTAGYNTMLGIASTLALQYFSED